MGAPALLALSGPPEALERLVREAQVRERLQQAGLQKILKLPHLVLFTRDMSSSQLGDRCWLVGHLHDPTGAMLPGNEGPSGRVSPQDPYALLEQHWGSYAAFFADPCGGTVQILRDPSGAVPVHFTNLDGCTLFFSELEAARIAFPLELRPDPRFALQWLAFPYLRTAQTGVCDVRELLPGELARLDGARVATELAWDPWTFADRAAAFGSFEEARAALRATLLHAIPRSVEGHQHPLLELSGGLDSSIIAVCLANAGVPFAAVNFVTRTPDGDERRYAEAVAQRTGCTLISAVEPECELDLSVPTLRLRPGLNPVLQPVDRALGQAAASVGADAIVGGAGGDNVFCYLTTAAPVVDAVRTLGFRPEALRTLMDTAALHECSVWTALRYAARKANAAPTRPHWKRAPDFLVAVVPPEPWDRHPWLDAPAGALPGKREHLEATVRIQHFLDLGDRIPGAVRVHPLMSQHVLETCLRVPSWMWSAGGVNRAVARSAVDTLLPDLIARRRTKGRLESLCARTFSQYRGELGELLLDGELARHGILNRAEVERYLGSTRDPCDERYLRLFELATVELWLRSFAT